MRHSAVVRNRANRAKRYNVLRLMAHLQGVETFQRSAHTPHPPSACCSHSHPSRVRATVSCWRNPLINRPGGYLLFISTYQTLILLIPGPKTHILFKNLNPKSQDPQFLFGSISLMVYIKNNEVIRLPTLVIWFPQIKRRRDPLGWITVVGCGFTKLGKTKPPLGDLCKSQSVYSLS